MKKQNNQKINIIIGGDVSPRKKYKKLFMEGDPEPIFGGLADEIYNADLSIINLEGPIIKTNTPIVKIGPIFGYEPDCIKGLVNSGISGVNLANNHIMDHGEKGLSTTIQALKDYDIFFFGAGEALNEAGKIHIELIKEKRVGFLGMADHEFSIAGKNSPGANPTDEIAFVRKMRSQRAELDYLIVLLHEGIQHFPFPTPRIQKLCRFLVEEGADAVICQHSHCPGAYEIYNGRPIVYGQGDLLSDSRSQLKDDRGYLVKLVFDENVKMTIIPFHQLDQGGVRGMEGKDFEDFINYITQLNQILSDPHLLDKQWSAYYKKNQDSYIRNIYGLNRWLGYLNRKFHFINFISEEKIAILLNIFRCAAHRKASLIS